MATLLALPRSFQDPSGAGGRCDPLHPKRAAAKRLLQFLLWLFALSSGATYAVYPDHPIKVIVPWPAGGSGDLVGRVFSDFLTRKLNNAVVVENRAGANAGIGTMLVTRAAADGYTLLVTTSEPLTINPVLSTDLQYDAQKQLEPIALIARTHFVLVANKTFPAQDLQQLIVIAKQQPEKLTVGTYGVADMYVAFLESRTQTSFLRVPYQGASPALAAMLGNTVDMTWVASSTAEASRETATILGVASARRLPTLPNVPTFAEQGLADFKVGNWLSLWSPIGLSSEVRSALTLAAQSVVESAEFKRQLSERGIDAEYGSADELRALVQTELTRWRGLVNKKAK